MTMRIGAKGQVVIPKEIRDRAGLHPGDRVDVDFRDGEVVLVKPQHPSTSLGGRYADSAIDSAARLLEDRRREPR